MYSAHTHETTHGALIADADQVTRTTPGAPLSGSEKSRLARGAAIVIETDRDMYVGRLDVQLAGGKIVNFDWQAIPVDDSVEPDPDVQAVVDAIEDPFTDRWHARDSAHVSAGRLRTRHMSGYGLPWPAAGCRSGQRRGQDRGIARTPRCP